jgi:hypothetical protein
MNEKSGFFKTFFKKNKIFCSMQVHVNWVNL